MAPDDESMGQSLERGDSFSFTPKRSARSNECRAFDKDLEACVSPGQILELVGREAHAMDAANWSILFYSLAHCKKKHSGPNAVHDPRWAQSCRAMQDRLAELTARDTSNLLWSLATLQARDEPLFTDSAEALCVGGKLAVCDPMSVAKSAWAMTGIAGRDKRLQLYGHLAVPVVLRAEAFPLGALTMTCYAFAKAAYQGSDLYESLSMAIQRQPPESLRPIDVCNVIWAFCTVGYRDDDLFTSLCDSHLCVPEQLACFNPQDITNTSWGMSKVGFVHTPAMDCLAAESVRQRSNFKPIHFSNLFYSFATSRLRGPDHFLAEMADAAVQQISFFDSGNLAITVWALAMLRERHPFIDAALVLLQKPDICRRLLSRTFSMLFLAFFRLDRVDDVDAIVSAAAGVGVPIGSSGYSALMMTAEQGPDAAREKRLQYAMAAEAQDPKMRAAIGTSAAIRMWKRELPGESVRWLLEMRASDPGCWSVVAERLLARLAPELAEASSAAGRAETWARPVTSGIHPIAATRQNEGPHAYTREFMTLQSVLCTAPAGDVDACMVAVEQFAESRSLWLKITAWEKAVVVYEAARLKRPRNVVEIGAYVGYSAMNLARAVRPHGGKVISLEVDPMHVTIVRNMVEFAGVSDTVDVWTGYCYDVIPHLLEKYGPKSIDMVFMDQKGTRFHTDMGLLKDLGLLSDGALILADNVLKPGAPLYIWHLGRGPYTDLTAISVREFLLQSEDWMVLGFHDENGAPVQDPPPSLHRLAFESDAFRKRSMFDSVAPSKADWWKFSQGFVDGLDRCGVKPRIVGLHGRDNPVIQPADIRAIFERAGRLPPALD